MELKLNLYSVTFFDDIKQIENFVVFNNGVFNLTNFMFEHDESILEYYAKNKLLSKYYTKRLQCEYNQSLTLCDPVVIKIKEQLLDAFVDTNFMHDSLNQLRENPNMLDAIAQLHQSNSTIARYNMHLQDPAEIQKYRDALIWIIYNKHYLDFKRVVSNKRKLSSVGFGNITFYDQLGYESDVSSDMPSNILSDKSDCDSDSYYGTGNKSETNNKKMRKFNYNDYDYPNYDDNIVYL